MQESRQILGPTIGTMPKRAAIKIVCAVLLSAVLVCAAIAQDAGGMGTLSGVVLNSQGRPVPGASVTMQTANGGSPHATVTNSQGRFFFPELVHGYYDVRAAHKELASAWKHNIEVNTGKQTDVRLQLAPVQKKQ